MKGVQDEMVAEFVPGDGQFGRRLGIGLGRVVWRSYRGENSGILIGAMILLVIVFGFLLRSSSFLSLENFYQIIVISTTITVMAVPTVFVISSGEIDLSFAAVEPVAALITAQLMSMGLNMVLSILAGLAAGALVGLVNGLVTVGFRIPSFVVTLGTMGILEGLSQIITNDNTVSVSNSTFLFIFGAGYVGSVPVLAFWSLAVLVVGGVLLSATRVGRKVLATGANPNAARFSGINTRRIKVGVLVASGMAGALAGLLDIGRFGAATYTLGSSDLLTVIAAAIIGGTVLSGGRGSVLGAVVASLLMGTLNNALILVGFESPEELVAFGMIIVIAVIFSAREGRGGRELWGWLSRLERQSDLRPPGTATAAGGGAVSTGERGAGKE